jgi:hypothetical protein
LFEAERFIPTTAFSAMDKTFDLIAISPWLAPCLQSGNATNRIPAAQAKDFVGQDVVVVGRVVQLVVLEKVIYVNLEKAHPNTPFTAVIFAAHAKEFGDVRDLQDKTVAISGKVIQFQDRPEIVVSEKRQLEILDGPPAAKK